MQIHLQPRDVFGRKFVKVTQIHFLNKIASMNLQVLKETLVLEQITGYKM